MTLAGEKPGEIVDDRECPGSASAQMIVEDRATDDGPAVVVRVEETISPALAGREGAVYESPPLTRAHALVLVRLLIGRDCQTAARDYWRCPIAGGQRTITLQPAARAGTGANGRESATGARP